MGARCAKRTIACASCVSPGIVERIGARSTEIRTLDHVSIIVPNSRFLEKEVINWSHSNPISRLHLPVGVAYSSDPKAVQSALLEAASKHPNVLYCRLLSL
ncbi:mechanosensitive ion channel family protein [Nostoc sp.]|uniref:mechanosensitive ion channel family protein n=1 Tax=Nostoc sp. TaxID=1180 RepID=UPI002FFA7EC4